MNGFVNEFDANLQVGITVAIVILAPVFGYFYNRLMDLLAENEHTSLYVAIGVAVNLFMAALVSWKSSVLLFVLFILTGMPMIIGEFARTTRKVKTQRRKRLPYAANGILDEAKMATTEAHKLLGKAISADNDNERMKLLAAVGHEISTSILKITEVKQIQEK